MENRFPARTPKIPASAHAKSPTGRLASRTRRPSGDPRRKLRRPQRRSGGHRGPDGAGRTELAMSDLRRSYGAGTSPARSRDARSQPVDVSDRAAPSEQASPTSPKTARASGACSRRYDHAQHHAGQPARRRARRHLNERAEKRVAEKYREAIWASARRGFSEGREPVGRQSAEGRAVEMAVRRTRGADPRRADTRASMWAQSTKSTVSSTKLAADGKGVVMISSEMPELLGMCDRIYVMNEGAFVGETARRRGQSGAHHVAHRERIEGTTACL
jgi:putative multiple sugar transport system ATP-binding protein